MKYKILKDLVSFNTINDKENIKIINYIKKYLENLKFKVEIINNNDKKCLIVKSKKATNEENIYEVDDEELIIANVQPGTTIEEAIGNIDTNATEPIIVKEADGTEVEEGKYTSEKMKTGMEITFNYKNKRIRIYKIVLRCHVL